MIGLIVGFLIGLIVGWNFFPQPAAVKEIIDKMLGRTSTPSTTPTTPSAEDEMTDRQTRGTIPDVEAEPDQLGRRY